MTDMAIERFREILSAYGCKEQNWPAAERKKANDFITADENARKLLEEMNSLDSILDLNDIAQPSNDLRSAILSDAVEILAVQKHPMRNMQWGEGRGLWSFIQTFMNELLPGTPAWQPVMMLFVVAMLGVSIGGYVNRHPEGDKELIAAFGGDYEIMDGEDYLQTFIGEDA